MNEWMNVNIMFLKIFVRRRRRSEREDSTVDRKERSKTQQWKNEKIKK